MKRWMASLPFLAAPAFAQCVMCFRTAAAQQSARAHVLNMGVLLLGVPPFLILAGFCVLFVKKNKVTRNESPPQMDTDEHR